MANWLDDGDTRLGWIVDATGPGARAPALLSRTGGRTELEIGWESDDPDRRIERWFAGPGAMWMDDPNKTKYQYSPPSTVRFADVDGEVILLGCQAAGHTMSMYRGRGTIRASRTVFSGNGSDYGQIHGMRSYVPGISQWLGLRSMTFKENRGPQGLRSLDVTLTAPSPVRLTTSLNFRAVPTFRFRPHAAQDTSEIVERILLQTSAAASRDWQDHEQLHFAVRELISVSAWKQHNLTEINVLQQNDPVTFLGGGVAGPRWAPAMLNRFTEYPYTERDSLRFMFTFADIRARGVHRWMNLRTKYARGLDPILHTLGQQGVAIEVQVAETGMGLDGIGYQLALDAGRSTNQANGEKHQERLLRVYRDIPATMPFPEEPWATDTANAYNATKHANRQLPTFEEYLEARRTSQLLVRCWIAARLGMPRRALRDAIARDPMSTPVELV